MLTNHISLSLKSIYLSKTKVQYFIRKILSSNGPLYKKWSFPLRIFSIHTTKSAVPCGFGGTKVACVVNLKVVFKDQFFYNLVVLIKLCKIRQLQKGRPLLFPRNQVFCVKNWKLWWAPATIEFHIFCWNFFYLVMPAKGCAGFFLFCLDLEFSIKV